MKKLFYSVAALALLFFAVSCQQDNLETVNGNIVTYSVQVPDALITKAQLGDELIVDQLIYEVYREAELDDLDKEPIYEGTAEINADGKASLPLEFVKNQRFTVLFWAQNSSVTAYTTTDLRDVTLSTALTSNNLSAAVYAGSDKVDNCVSASNGSVTLSRPIAQLNLATSAESLTAGTAAVILERSYAKVKGLSTTYNVATKAVGTDKSEFVYDFAIVPNATLPVNGTDYTYVSMNYVGFIPTSGTTIDVDYIIDTDESDQITHSIYNVSVKPNYRTNIVGNLITGTTDYSVSLESEWTGVAEDIQLWDGKAIKAPTINADGEYVIGSASELAWLAAAVNGTLPPSTRSSENPEPNNFEGKTVILSQNIHLNDMEWTPIGNEKDQVRFHGTFDGKGHTIYGLSILKYHGQRQHALFGSVAGTPTIKNLTIYGAKVVMPEGHNDDFYASALLSSFYGTVKIENVIVKNAIIAGNNKVGGLLAHDAECTSMIITDCHVLDSDIRSTHIADGGNVGGFIGFFQGQANNEHKISNSSVKNSTIYGINSKNSGNRSNGEFVGCLSGKDNQTLIIEDCVISGNTFTQNDGVTYVSPYGVFVGGNRNDDGKGTVIVDGKTMISAGLAKEGNKYYVSSAVAFQRALDLFALDNNAHSVEIILLDNCKGDVNFTQVPEKSFVLDGNGKTMNGTIKFLARAGESESSIHIKNFNFVTTDNERTFILSSETNYYPNNVTISDCTFQGTGASSKVVPVNVKSAYNLVIEDCTADSVHSLFQNDRGGKNYIIRNCSVTNAGRGISLNSVIGAALENVQISASNEKYGIRINAENECTITISNCEISSFIPVVVREAKVDVKLLFNGENTMTPANTDGLWCAIGTSEYDTNGTMPTDPTGKVTVKLNDASLSKSGIYGAYMPQAMIGEQAYATFYDAVKVAQEGDTITLLEDAELYFTDEPMYNNIYASVIDLNDKTLTIKDGDLRFATTTIKNGNIVVEPKHYVGTAVFLMYGQNTLTIENTNITATGVSGTYLIGLEGESNLKLYETAIYIENDNPLDLDVISSYSAEGYIIIEDSEFDITNLDGRVCFSGNYNIINSEIVADFVKAGFYIRDDYSLKIDANSRISVTNLIDGKVNGIDLYGDAQYEVADGATVNATVGRN